MSTLAACQCIICVQHTMSCICILLCVDYLDHYPVPTGDINVEVSCDLGSVQDFTGWSLSLGGTVEMINRNATGPKYTTDGTTLRINNVSASDEGLYRCIYRNGVERKLCIYVHGN